MMLSAAAKHLARRHQLVAAPASSALAPAAALRAMSTLEQFDEYGKSVFAGKVADEYLAKHGAKGEILKDPTWVKKHADTVAKAVFDW
jgi:glutamine synthetase